MPPLTRPSRRASTHTSQTKTQRGWQLPSVACEELLSSWGRCCPSRTRVSCRPRSVQGYTVLRVICADPLAATDNSAHVICTRLSIHSTPSQRSQQLLPSTQHQQTSSCQQGLHQAGAHSSKVCHHVKNTAFAEVCLSIALSSLATQPFLEVIMLQSIISE